MCVTHRPQIPRAAGCSQRSPAVRRRATLAPRSRAPIPRPDHAALLYPSTRPCSRHTPWPWWLILGASIHRRSVAGTASLAVQRSALPKLARRYYLDLRRPDSGATPDAACMCQHARMHDDCDDTMQPARPGARRGDGVTEMRAAGKNAAWLRLPLLLLTILIQASARNHSGGGYRRGFHKHSDDVAQDTSRHRRRQLPPPKHFIVALVDDLGGYNVPWRNPEQTMSDDILRACPRRWPRRAASTNEWTTRCCPLCLRHLACGQPTPDSEP